MSVPEDRLLEKLLDDGVEIPEDEVEIERLLAGQEGDPEEEKTDEPPKGEEPEKPDSEPTKADEEPAKDDDLPKEPPAAVVRTLRESLHTRDEQLKEREEALTAADAKIELLEGRLTKALAGTADRQDELQDKADQITDAGVKLEDLTDERLAEIREEAGDEAADLLSGLLAQFKSVSGKVKELEEAQEALVQEREDLTTQQVRSDLDTVPLLSVLEAARGDEADARWARALQYEKALKNDPDWADKPRAEVFQEVGKRMEAYLGEKTVTALLGDKVAPKKQDKEPSGKTPDEKVDEAMRIADDAAVPTSLSDLPAGEPPPQSEIERAGSMSIADIEETLEKAFEKAGPDGIDEAMSRLLTAEPGT